jgi:hypothetical protein
MKLAASDKKLKELVLYIAGKSQGDETFGAIKLNKLLFYADFLAYLNFGKPITHQDYFRLPKGPAPRRFVPVWEQMLAGGDIVIKSKEYFGFPQNRIVPLRKANLSLFDPDEIDLVDRVIEIHRGKTASEISDESHGFMGWALARDQETIPYAVALVSRRPLTKTESRHAKSLVPIAEGLLEEEPCRENCPVGA